MTYERLAERVDSASVLLLFGHMLHFIVFLSKKAKTTGMLTMLIGYARVSTQEQETHAQTDALNMAKCDVIYTEKRSGGSMSRPVLLAVLRKVQKGDVLLVYKIDRVARSLRDLLEILEKLEKKGAGFRSLTECIDTSTPTGKLILQILGAFAEFERALIRERTRVGMAAALKRGSVFGRPKALASDEEQKMLELWFTGDYTKTELANRYRIHISSVKRAIARDIEKKQSKSPCEACA